MTFERYPFFIPPDEGLTLKKPQLYKLFTLADLNYQSSWWNQIIFPHQRSTTVFFETYSFYVLNEVRY